MWVESGDCWFREAEIFPFVSSHPVFIAPTRPSMRPKMFHWSVGSWIEVKYFPSKAGRNVSTWLSFRRLFGKMAPLLFQSHLVSLSRLPSPLLRSREWWDSNPNPGTFSQQIAETQLHFSLSHLLRPSLKSLSNLQVNEKTGVEDDGLNLFECQDPCNAPHYLFLVHAGAFPF